MSSNHFHSRTVDAFALRYGICRATVYNLIARGELNVTKAGRRTIITEKQESDWLSRSERGYASKQRSDPASSSQLDTDYPRDHSF